MLSAAPQSSTRAASQSMPSRERPCISMTCATAWIAQDVAAVPPDRLAAGGSRRVRSRPSPRARRRACRARSRSPAPARPSAAGRARSGRGAAPTGRGRSRARARSAARACRADGRSGSRRRSRSPCATRRRGTPAARRCGRARAGSRRRRAAPPPPRRARACGSNVFSLATASSPAFRQCPITKPGSAATAAPAASAALAEKPRKRSAARSYWTSAAGCRRRDRVAAPVVETHRNCSFLELTIRRGAPPA